jgi:hypothetical protein
LGHAYGDAVVCRPTAGLAKKLAWENMAEREIHQRLAGGIPLRLNVRFLPDMVSLGTVRRNQ